MKVFVLILIIKKKIFLHVYWSKKMRKQCIKIGNSTENSEISRNFREDKLKNNQIHMKFSISNLLFWFLTVFFVQFMDYF